MDRLEIEEDEDGGIHNLHKDEGGANEVEDDREPGSTTFEFSFIDVEQLF